MDSKEYCLEKIRNRKRDFLSYDIDFENVDYSVEFLNFYCSFMIWNMGHARNELTYDILRSLPADEKKIAVKLIEENFKNGSLVESFLDSLFYFKNQREVEAFLKEKLQECENELLFHSYISILRRLKERRQDMGIDFYGAVKVVMEKGAPEHIVNLLWSSKLLVGERYIEIFNFYRGSEDEKIREVVRKVLR